MGEWLRRLRRLIGKVYVLSPFSIKIGNRSITLLYYGSSVRRWSVGFTDAEYVGVLLGVEQHRTGATLHVTRMLTLALPLLPSLSLAYSPTHYVGMSTERSDARYIYGVWWHRKALYGALGSTQPFYSPLLRLPRPLHQAIQQLVLLPATGILPEQKVLLKVMRIPVESGYEVRYIYKVVCQPAVLDLPAVLEIKEDATTKIDPDARVVIARLVGEFKLYRSLYAQPRR